MASKSPQSLILLFLCLLLPATHVLAASIRGTVHATSGEVLAGAQVTLTSPDGLFAETVYSNAHGQYTLTTKQQQFTSVRARKINYADSILSLEPGQSKLDFKLRKLETEREISEHLTASAYFTRVKLDDPTELKFFRIECLTCHQIGNAYTRMPRPRDRWLQIMERMLGFYGVRDKQRIERYADIMMQAYDGTVLSVEQKLPVDPLTFGTHITQWKLPGAVIAHDVEFHAADGKFYTVDQGLDRIYITDPLTNLTETFAIPADGIPVGGKFLAVFNEPHPFSLAVSRGPHSLQEGPDGKFYTTDTVSGQIGVFDPRTRQYTGHDIGGKAMYPHTIRFDNTGMAWFSIGVSNQVGRFNPQTGEMTLIDLPATSDRPQFPVFMPYGIDVHPLDGSIWYSRLMANRIGRIDPVTFEVKEFQPPLVGPRRMRFAKDGTLWIPAYGSGSLVKLNTATMEYREYPIPPLSPGELDAPYAVGVHPQTQEVWITANMSDRMFRFLPGEERFVSYPLPTRGIFLRDVIFTPAGRVCAASSMAPVALAVEGGMEEIICIDPDYYPNPT